MINHLRNQPEKSDIINIKQLVRMIFRNWYLFIIGLVIAMAVGYYYIKEVIPVFRVTSTILIEEGENSRIQSIDNSLLEGFGLRPGAKNMDNQIIILHSWTLIRNALDDLNFETDCYKKGLMKARSYFPLYPIRIVPGPDGIVPYNTEFLVQYINDEIYHLSVSSKSAIQLDTVMAFGQILSLSQGSFSIFQYPYFKEIQNSGDEVYFQFYNPESLTHRYRNRLRIESASKDGTIVRLILEGTNRAKDVVFIDKLVEMFLLNNLEKKNHEAKRIIQFIDEQLVDVQDSLLITENQLTEFRSRNRIMDVSAQAQQIIDQAVLLENEKASLTLNANYYNYLDDYLSKENNQEIPISPSTMSIEDPMLNSLMHDLAGLQAEFSGSGVGERNPLQAQLELRIQNTKQSLRETLQGIKLANQMALDENRQQISRLNLEASRLPVKERQLLGFERKFNLNNVLYTFLLQKRAEAQIQKASNKSDNELVDSARPDPNPIAPNMRMIFAIAFLLGMGFPFFIVVAGNRIINKISTEEDIKMISDLPVVGHIPHSRLKYNSVVLNEPNSRIAEAFRSLRSRMEFFTAEANCPVILISSATPEDGKSFAAVNLASAYSIADKRTVLVGFDLRRPTLSKTFDMNENIGLSTYLIGKSTIDEVIYDTGYANLDIISSGPIPPNPGELCSSEKIKGLLTSLRKMYDYIIVDSAPIGTVSDNYSLAAIADATLIMVRHGKTKKNILRATLAEAQAYGIRGLCLLVNDVKLKGSSYQYSYKYRYEYNKSKSLTDIQS